MILLGVIVRVFLNLKSNAKTGEWERTKRSVRAIVLLTPLLGITWIFGVLAIDESTKWFLYLFSICNSLQVMSEKLFASKTCLIFQCNIINAGNFNK